MVLGLPPPGLGQRSSVFVSVGPVGAYVLNSTCQSRYRMFWPVGLPLRACGMAWMLFQPPIADHLLFCWYKPSITTSTCDDFVGYSRCSATGSVVSGFGGRSISSHPRPSNWPAAPRNACGCEWFAF